MTCEAAQLFDCGYDFNGFMLKLNKSPQSKSEKNAQTKG